jgi:hypothetical protein
VTRYQARVLALACCALAGLAASACKHDKSKAVAASYSSVTRPLPVVAAPLSAIGVASIPVEEEYEERSATAITPANLLAQLAQIEKEIR